MIIIAIEKNKRVYVYTDKESFSVEGLLYNYNETFVAIKSNINPEIIYIYRDNGKLCYQYPKDFVDTTNINGIIL